MMSGRVGPPCHLRPANVACFAGADDSGRKYAQGLPAEFGFNVVIPSAQACADMIDAVVAGYDLSQACVLCSICGHLWLGLPATIYSGRRGLPPEQLEELRVKTCAH